MPKARSTAANSPSRRALLGAAAGAAALPLAATTARASQALPPPAGAQEADPVIALATEYDAIRRAQEALSGEESALRTALLDRYGPPRAARKGGLSPAAEDDAQAAQLRDVIEQSDMLGDRASDVFGKLMEARPTTTAGVVAKLEAALQGVAYVDADLPQAACFVAMRDAVRFLSGREGVA